MAAIRDFSLVLFLSTPSARRATDAPLLLQYGVGISIHALREEGDRASSTTATAKQEFLSTPSARRATHNGRVVIIQHQISIHALREEGDFCSSPFLA